MMETYLHISSEKIQRLEKVDEQLRDSLAENESLATELLNAQRQIEECVVKHASLENELMHERNTASALQAQLSQYNTTNSELEAAKIREEHMIRDYQQLLSDYQKLKDKYEKATLPKKKGVYTPSTTL